MKARILLISATIAALVSANSFATTITKGRLVSHKEWSTNNDKFSFKQMTSMNSLKLQLPGKMNKTNEGVSTVVSYTEDDAGVTGSPIAVSGKNFVVVYNNTSDTQEYDYTLQICAEITDHETHCAFYDDIVELEPGGTFQNDEAPSLEVTLANAGTYHKSVASTVVSGDMTAPNQSESVSLGTITVTDGSKK